MTSAPAVSTVRADGASAAIGVFDPHHDERIVAYVELEAAVGDIEFFVLDSQAALDSAARMRAMRVGVLNIFAASLHATRLVSSLRVTAKMRSASAAPACVSTSGCAALPTTVRRSSWC